MASKQVDCVLVVDDGGADPGAWPARLTAGGLQACLIVVAPVELEPNVVLEVELPQIVGLASVDIATKDVHRVVVGVAAGRVVVPSWRGLLRLTAVDD